MVAALLLSAGVVSAGEARTSIAAVTASSGCSCDAGGSPAPGFAFVFAFVAATVWARGRRRS